MMTRFSSILLPLLFTATICFSQSRPHIKGNTIAARRSKHHEFRGTKMIAQIGYIDTSRVTVKELIDNLEIGLVTVPNKDYEIVSFNLGCECKCHDYFGPFTFSGNKIRFAKQEKTDDVLSMFQPGDRLFFEDIKAKRTGQNNIVSLDPVVIVVIP